MEISESNLRSMVADVDELHREGMGDMPEQIAELHQGEGARLMGPSRAKILRGIGVGGLALAIGQAVLPFRRLLSPAYALDDAGIAAFAESVELAAVEAYKAAAASGKVTTPAVGEAAASFASQHEEHAAAFGSAAGSAATNTANPGLLTAVGAQVSGAADEAAIVKIAYDLENAAAATYIFALGALTSSAALQLTASILPVESAHAVVLGSVLGLPATDYIPGFETAAQALSPDQYPVA